MSAMDAIRAEILAQPEPERLAYALDLLEWYLDPLPAWWQGAAALGLDLRAGELRVLHALDRRRGQYVTHDALLTALAWGDDPEAAPSPRTLARAVGTIRRACAAHGVSVENWHGIGYRMTAPAAFSIEAAGGLRRGAA